MATTPKKSNKKRSVVQVSSPTEFIEWVKKIGGQNMLFRGLANVEWKVESSLYRRLKINGLNHVDSDMFLEMTKVLINHARQDGHDMKNGHELSDLELLVDLQHYGAATCLIDFTKHSLIALCFACETAYDTKNKEVDGLVFAFNSDNTNLYNEITKDTKKEIGEWLQNEKLWILSPKKLNNRITSQQSMFVFGSPTLPDKNFHICKITNKKEILEELKKNGISARMLFDDFVGFSALNSHNKKYESWDTDSDFVSGRICEASGNFESAIKYYDKTIKSNPQDYKAYNNRGNAKSHLNNIQDAISDLNESIKLNPNNYKAYSNRGLAKHNLGNFQDAIRDCDEAIKSNPKSFEAYNNRGIAKHKLHKFQDAIHDYDKSIKLNPNNYKAYSNRGLAKYNLNNFQDAIHDCDEAIKLNPKSFESYYNRGLTRSELGDIKGAAVDFAKAKKINPEIDIPDLPPNKFDK